MQRKINIHFIFVLLAAMLWGMAGIFVRTLGESLAPMQLVLGRAFISAVLLAVIILIKNKSLFKIKLKDLWLFAAAGLFSIVLFNYSYYTTMSLTSLSVAAVLLYTAPFFVVIISLFLFKEKLTLNKTTACLVAFIGCCFVSGLFDSSHRISAKALFFGLLTGFGYALYTVFGELLLKRGYKTLTITFYVFLFAAAFCIPLNNIKETFLGFGNPKVIITVILMAVFNTVLPYIFYTAGLMGVDPSAAPIIATAEPVVATVVGAVIYKENITVSAFLGIILVLCSVILLNKKGCTVSTFAKINLTLAIKGKRKDGYHLIDTVMQSVSIADTLKVLPSNKITVSCENKVIDNSDNIAYKAAELFFKTANIKGGAKIKIKKRIPLAAGLGGGSADAAAVLVALNKIYNAGLTNRTLEEIALKLGADVPFFIEGGTKRAEGIGEVMTKLPPLTVGYFILAKTENKPSTAEMYKKLDALEPITPDTELLIKALEQHDTDLLISAMGNSFTSVWQNSALEKRLKNTDADGVSLSGSGPVWFAFFKSKKTAIKTYKQLKSEKIECYLVKPCDSAIEFE